MKRVLFNDPTLGVTEAALEQEFALPRGLLTAIRTKGERSNSDQVSPKGAKGVYQFMPDTWAKFAEPGADPRDAEAAALAAARYMAYASKLYGGNPGAMLAEYNGGPKAAKKYLQTGDPGNAETRKYLANTLPSIGQEAGAAPAAQVMQQAITSPFGNDAYTTSQQQIFSTALLDGIDPETLDSRLDTPDLDMVADQMLDTQVSTIVDEVLNG
jgi:hypothetical protein